jgi:hypothetical protein
MSLIDLVNQCNVTANIMPASYAATTQGQAVDLSNSEIGTHAVIKTGTIGSATTIMIQLEEATTTAAAYTAITGSIQIGTISANGTVTNVTTTTNTTCVVAFTTTNQQAVFRGLRTQRYARINAITFTATTTPAIILEGDIIAQYKISGSQYAGYSRSPST